jgi:hypothetical protein
MSQKPKMQARQYNKWWGPPGVEQFKGVRVYKFPLGSQLPGANCAFLYIDFVHISGFVLLLLLVRFAKNA